MKSCFLFFLLLSFSITNTFSQAPVKLWDYRFGGGADEELKSIEQTTDGGYILGGSSLSGISGDKTQASRGSWDYWIVKIDSNGIKQWDATFGGSNEDRLGVVRQTPDGGYILGGYSWSGATGDKTQESWGFTDYWVVKTDQNGVKEWDYRYGGTGYDYGYTIDLTSDGGYVVGGVAGSALSGDISIVARGGYDQWFIKIDALGIKEWDARFGGTDTDELYSIEQTTDGGFISGADSESPANFDKTQSNWGQNDYWIVKSNSEGAKEWDVRFGGTGFDYMKALQQTTDEGYLLSGYSTSLGNGDKTQWTQGANDYWIVKTDYSGNKQWDVRFGGIFDEYLSSAKQTLDRGFIFGGWTYSPIGGDVTESSRGFEDFWIVKTDPIGVKQYDQRLGGPGSDYLTCLRQTSDSGYIFGGYTNSGIGFEKSQTSQGGFDYWIVKTASDQLVAECGTPSYLNVTNVTATTANLVWYDAGADSYLVGYREKLSGSKWTFAKDGIRGPGIKNTHVTLTGLTPGTTYIWRISSLCGNSSLPEDGVRGIEFTTLPFRTGNNSDNELNSMNISPNPTTGNFRIVLSEKTRSIQIDSKGIIQIINSLGQIVYQESVQIIANAPNTIQIDLGSKVKNGIYTVLVKTGADSYLDRIELIR